MKFVIFVALSSISASESAIKHHQRVKEVEQYFKLPDRDKQAQEKIKHDNQVIHDKAAGKHKDDYRVALSSEQQEKLYLIGLVSLLTGVLVAMMCCIGVYCFKEKRKNKNPYQEDFEMKKQKQFANHRSEIFYVNQRK